MYKECDCAECDAIRAEYGSLDAYLEYTEERQ